jgi:predicted permease
LWVAAVPIVGVDLAVTMGGRTQSIGLEPVVGVSLVAGLLGWALLAALESRTRRAAVIWTALALVVTVLSLALPLTSAAGAASGAVLVALHLLVAAILIPGLRRRAPGR